MSCNWGRCEIPLKRVLRESRASSVHCRYLCNCSGRKSLPTVCIHADNLCASQPTYITRLWTVVVFTWEETLCVHLPANNSFTYLKYIGPAGSPKILRTYRQLLSTPTFNHVMVDPDHRGDIAKPSPYRVSIQAVVEQSSAGHPRNCRRNLRSLNWG